jgi:acyl-CoA synthetase (AMP-forming)/AMP-acid ligase II
MISRHQGLRYTYGQLVIGVPDKKYGEEVCAWIRFRQGYTATENEIRDFCRGQIAIQDSTLRPFRE